MIHRGLKDESIDRYDGSLAKVSKVHDVLCRAHRVMSDALIDASEGGRELPVDGDWCSTFRRAPEPVPPLELLQIES